MTSFFTIFYGLGVGCAESWIPIEKFVFFLCGCVDAFSFWISFTNFVIRLIRNQYLEKALHPILLCHYIWKHRRFPLMYGKGLCNPVGREKKNGSRVCMCSNTISFNFIMIWLEGIKGASIIERAFQMKCYRPIAFRTNSCCTNEI